ncbi:MAG: response regulator [Hahellaceae bacterium]|nr:response regulator [Hahellaceae bacterium]MCP5210107.1 response regulator [Hahellaceae bacterium]
MQKDTASSAIHLANRREQDGVQHQRTLVLRIAYCLTIFFLFILVLSQVVSASMHPALAAYIPCLIALVAIKAGVLNIARVCLFASALALAGVLPGYFDDQRSALILLAACVPLPFLLFTRAERHLRVVAQVAILLVTLVTQYAACTPASLQTGGLTDVLGICAAHLSLAIQLFGLFALALFVHLLARKFESVSASLYRSEQKIEAVITSMNDVVFEINNDYKILNIWAGDESNLPQPRAVFENADVSNILPESLFKQFRGYVDLAIASGREQRFEYISPANQRFYEACVKRLSFLPTEEPRVAVSLRDISDQQEARKHLQIQNCFVEKHWDSVIYTDLAGDVSFANEVTYRQNRLKPNSLNGQHISFLLADKKYLVDLILTELKKQQSWRGETTLTRGDGETVRITLAVMILHNEAKEPFALAWSMRDITAMKQAERKLRLSEKRFKSMAVNAPGIIYEWYALRDGSEWGFNYLSPRIEEILGLDPGKCQADVNEMMQYLHPEDVADFVDSVNEVTRNLSGWNHVSRLILPGNDVRWMRGISTPIDCDDKRVVFHGILMDITQQVVSQDELLKAKERAEEAIQEKSNFLSTMSHEIRTPLNAVIGLSHLLLQEEPHQEQIENLRTLKFSAESLLGLINDILDFSKIEAGKIALEKIPVNMRELVKGIVSSLEFQAHDKGIDLRTVIDPALPEQILGDPLRLSQVLNNLISNAIKFTDEGFVEVKLAVRDSPANKVAIEFSVKDSGIGIERDKQEAIFEFFNQADNSVTRRYGGTGLGLAITRGILQLYGSEIKLSSAPENGSVFSFIVEFPVALNASAPVLPESINDNLQGCRILLVEDNRVNVMVASKLLNSWGARIDVASDGLAAIQLVQENDYDLVLMDIQMPVMDGYEATLAIRQLQGKYSRLPIIALTATVMEEVQRRTKEVGLDGILSKPIKPGELRSQLVRYIQ